MAPLLAPGILPVTTMLLLLLLLLLLPLLEVLLGNERQELHHRGEDLRRVPSDRFQRIVEGGDGGGEEVRQVGNHCGLQHSHGHRQHRHRCASFLVAPQIAERPQQNGT